jgi:hypothetical protein
MKTNKNILAVMAVFLVGILAVSASVSAFGFGNNVEDRDLMDNALESGDYDAWNQLMSERINEDHFNEMVERHENRGQHRQDREEMRSAIETGNYDEYVTTIDNMEDLPDDFVVLDENDFNTLVQIHQYRQNGDYELAEELIENADFEFPMGPNKMGRGNGQGMGQGQHRGQRGNQEGGYLGNHQGGFGQNIQN